jgi:hypothetical protein
MGRVRRKGTVVERREDVGREGEDYMGGGKKTGRGRARG